jgi:peptidoglycan hydrolase CwlO-like protein
MYKIYSIFIVLLLLLMYTNVNGQEKMTRENWQKQIKDFTSLKSELSAKITNLQKDTSDLQAILEKKTEEIKIAEQEYWSTVGSKNEYETYKRKLDKLEAICKSRERSLDDAVKMFLELDTNLKCHPDFASMYNDIKKRLYRYYPHKE